MRPSRLVAATLVPLLACAPGLQIRHRHGVASDVVRETASAGTIQVNETEFTPAFRVLGNQVPIWERPLETARRLFGVPERSGTYLYEVRTRRLMPVAPDSPMFGETSEQEFVRDYFQWCSTALAPGDCLRVLEKNRTYNSHARYMTALAIGWQSSMGEMRESLRGMVNPSAVMSTIFAAMAMYMMLWVAPEPFSKGLAAALTIWLIGYFGFDSLWKLAKAWRTLVDEADAALNFDALRAAGNRFGEQAGPVATRLLILLTTLALGGTAGMASKGTSLPGFSLANAQAEGQLAVNLVTATAAESVLVGTQTVTITFAPGVLAMAAAAPPPGIPARTDSEPTITFSEQGAAGHGARHLVGTGLSREAVESAISAEIQSVVARAEVGASFWGRVTVQNQTIEFRAYCLPDGRINVGTYYPIP
jgi:hypothetical protein